MYIVLLSPDSTTDTPPFVPELVEYLCRVISRRGMGTIHHIRGKFNQQKYQRLLERHMVLYARVLYPEESFNFSRIIIANASKLIRDWFARRQDIELMYWPRRSPDVKSN